MGYVNEGTVVAIGVLFLVLGTAAVMARLVIQLRRPGARADAWFALAAWVFHVGLCSLMIVGSATHTFGSHSPPGLGPAILYYEAPRLTLTRKLQYSFEVLSICALGCLKLSILFFYRRLFSSTRAKLCNSVLISITSLWTVTFTICFIVQCGRHFNARFGSLKDLHEKCGNNFPLLIAMAATDVVVDLIILVIPIFMVFPLQMPLKKRLGVIGILMLGMSATACGIARLGLFAAILGPPLLSSPTVAGFPADDDIGVVSGLVFWGMLEVGIATIAVSLPVMYGLMRKWSTSVILGYFQSLISFISVPKGSGDPGDSTQELDNMGHRHDSAGSQADLVRGWDVRIWQSISHSLKWDERHGSQKALINATERPFGQNGIEENW
ncbi:hypothetical protein BDV11DRAFT_176228 [Aspergillus similis]